MRKIVIADHHPLTRHGVYSILHKTKKYQIVAEVSRGSELLLALEKEKPDILILELKMPEINGFHALRSIRSDFPETKIVIFTSHPEEIYALRSVKSGAKAYIPKTIPPEKFLHAIESVATGGTFLNKKAALIKSGDPAKDTIESRYRRLSARELEVLNLLTTGKRNKDIAQLLGINEKTVSTYRTRLLKKLKVDNLAELIHQYRMFQIE